MSRLVFDQLAVEHVDRADEVGDEAGTRELVDLGRRPDLDDLALVHDADAGCQRHRLFLVVGHDDEGDAELLLQVDQLELRVLPQLPVQGTERLIEQQQLRTLHERPSERDPLTLPTRELVGLAPAEVAELDDVEHLAHATVDLGPHDAFLFETESDVRRDGHVREQRIGLEHHVDGPLVRRDVGHVLTVDEDATGGRRLEPRQHAQ